MFVVSGRQFFLRISRHKRVAPVHMRLRTLAMATRPAQRPSTPFRDSVLQSIRTRLATKSLDMSGSNLGIPQLVAAARALDGSISVNLCKSQEVQDNINKSRQFLEDSLKRGKDIYGVTTGFGGSAEVHTRQVERLQAELIRFMQCGFGDPLKFEVSRAGTIVRVNSNSKGFSGLRVKILDNLCALLNNGYAAAMPKRGSITASGDLMPLAYLAGLVLGQSHVQAWSARSGGVVSAKAALQDTGLEPIVLGAKEGLALINGTSIAAGMAALCVYDAQVLSLLSQVTTAMSVETLQGTDQSFHPTIHGAKPHPGQVDVASSVLQLLQGSQLCRHEIDYYDSFERFDPTQHKPRLRQDRYALRTSAQWLGPVVEILAETATRVTTEINSASDNPIIDAAGEKTLHGGNFQGSAIGLGCDSARLAVQYIGRLVFAQFTEIVNKSFNNGLSANLAGDDVHYDFGLKGIDICMSSFMSELEYLANPMSTHVKSAELHNQDVNSLGLLSARYLEDALDVLRQMLAAQLYALTQAADLRFLQTKFCSLIESSLNDLVETILPSAMSSHVSDLQKTLHEELSRLSISEFEIVYDTNLRIECLRQLVFVAQKYMEDNGLSMSPSDWNRACAALTQSDNADCGPMHVMHLALEAFANRLLRESAEHREFMRSGQHVKAVAASLGASREMYLFVREELGATFNAGFEPPGIQLQKIYTALCQQNQLEAALLRTFEGVPKQ